MNNNFKVEWKGNEVSKWGNDGSKNYDGQHGNKTDDFDRDNADVGGDGGRDCGNQSNNDSS